jgi:glycosyltransferase involved in cell wall biosynthesis
MPELITDGVTGVLADGVAGAAAGVARAAGFDRAACRREAERRFSADRMVDDYVTVYESLLDGR